MAWSPDNPQGHESRKIKYLIARYTRGRVLEIGCGTEKAYDHFIGVDNGHHFGKGAADIVANADDLRLFASESMDAVFSSHVLEHMQDMGKTLAEWGRVIKPGGYLVLYVPSANAYPKCGEPGSNPSHKHDIYPGDIANILFGGPDKWRQVEDEERLGGNEYSLFEVYRKEIPAEDMPEPIPEKRTVWDAIKNVFQEDKAVWLYEKEKAKKTVCVCRFGGFGDMLQTALIFPRLKEQGFHVTVMSTPKGQDIIRHDPNVDDWFILDTDQVPNRELSAFWHAQAQRFDRFVNLSESIEGTLLAMPGRPNHSWPLEVRQKRMNTNYHEFTAELAGVTFKPCSLFYPTAIEKENSREFLTRVDKDRGYEGKSFKTIWVLSGSSHHKCSPYLDNILAAMLLEMPEAVIYLVGDEACRVLEQGWEKEPRVILCSGKLSIRETLTLATQVDLVIGPETGVLNAVGMDKSPSKVLMLSHSSKSNLSKNWESTQALTPINCECYPCHMLHYSDEFCPRDTVIPVSKCSLKISPEAIFLAVKTVYNSWRRK